ncbi:MAG: transcription antitermination factor NusB [Clostridia bacterium]|nr:transcription antitermination factor NusB [Clostridia bacterium]
MRSLARETVYKYLFSQLFNPGDEELFSVLCKNDKLNAEATAFANDLLNVIQTNYQTILQEIEKFSIGYNIDRIFSTDKCALIIGIAELNYFKETPQIVVIDEAVKLARKYSTEKSVNFVNGILAKYIKK